MEGILFSKPGQAVLALRHALGSLVGFLCWHMPVQLALRHSQSGPPSAHSDHTMALTVAGSSFFAAAAALALLAPLHFWQLLAGTAALAVIFLAFRHTVACSVIWLLVAGATSRLSGKVLVRVTASDCSDVTSDTAPPGPHIRGL
jgi:hypothetical protein